MLCQECGYELPRNGSECRVCRNKKSWEDRVKKKTVESLFTRRIAKQLLSLSVSTDKEDIEKVQEGDSLYIFGTAGSGKTIYACVIALEIERYGFIFPDFPKPRIKFINSLNLLEEIRSSFNSSTKEEEKKTTEEILEYYSSVDLLILDDLGAERPTDWSLSILQMIINNRYEGLLPTLITSNLELEKLSEQLDDRIASRIYEMCKLVSFGNKDRRLRRS